MRVRALLIVGLLGGSLVAQGRSPLDLANAEVSPGGRRLAYGDDPPQFGELRVPSTPVPHPVAIVVHGGCWRAKLGAMDPRAVAMDNMRPLAAALTAAGVATWNVEYRRLATKAAAGPARFRTSRAPPTSCARLRAIINWM